MNKHFIWALIISLPMALGCQRLMDAEQPEDDIQIDQTEQNAPDVQDPTAVVTAEGKIMDVACLRSNANEIAELGRGAADRCIMGSADDSRTGRGIFSVTRGVWYYYYPPAFAGTSSNFFCSYVFSFNGLGNNCINDFFGFNNNFDSNFPGSFVNSCDHCANRPNPTRCYNRCWGNQNNFSNFYYPSNYFDWYFFL